MFKTPLLHNNKNKSLAMYISGRKSFCYVVVISYEYPTELENQAENPLSLTTILW